jgi:UDP-N-acetylglucosamine--N-acetylmuramyl-(pentapeptide) pyrophosphoryl-undecaprenol N-acetylglucosamine transferase
VTSPTIILAAGGTGGHMFPAKAFADALVARGAKVALVTDPRGKRYTDGFPTKDVLILPVSNADEGGIGGKIKAGMLILKSLGLVGPFMKALDPDAVVGFGGYPTFPVLQSAGKDVAVFVHEQNAVLGRVNKLFAGKAAKVASGFAMLEGLEDTTKHAVTGNPVRADIVAARSEPFPDSEHGLRLLVTGGSQGARILGQVVPEAIAQLPEHLRQTLFVSHQVREEQADEARETYANAGVQAEVWPFFQDMAGRIAKAHLVIGRSGASTVSETAVVGRPSILVPLAIATNDHQTFNAKALSDVGAADVLAEDEFTVTRLTALLEQRLGDMPALQKRAAAAKAVGKPDAAEALCDVVLGALAG